MSQKQHGEREIVLLDGGTGMSLVKMGHSSIGANPLWSAAVVRSCPEDLVKLHKEFFTAGAQVVVTATYQASVDTYAKYYSISEQEATDLVQESVRLAQKACNEVATTTGHRGYVAASVGPMGATFNDMSEYHGRYAEPLSRQEISDWHLKRLKVIMEAKPDLLAIETIPIVKEAEAIMDSLSHFPNAKAWVTFQCKDGEHTGHGEHISDAVRAVQSHDSVVAVGVNCVDPSYVSSLVKAMAQLDLSIPIIVKPNALNPKRESSRQKVDIINFMDEWIKEGATWIGGCCYVYPEDIAGIHSFLSSKPNCKLVDPRNVITGT